MIHALADAALEQMLNLDKFDGCKYDKAESHRARVALLAPLARAITAETQDPVYVAALIAVEHNESHGCRYVLEGHCDRGPAGEQCDWDPVTNRPLSRGPFQQRKHCKAVWSLPEGTYAAYRAGAHCTLSLLRFGWGKHYTWTGAFSALTGSGACCWSGAKKRIRVMNAVLPSLLEPRRVEVATAEAR